jgi:hypothetical protein
MKISPLASGGLAGVDMSANINPQATEAPRQAIKMQTNASPDRFVAESQEIAPLTEQSAITDTTETAKVDEETKPLSPQVAALAKERRAIQRERMELETLRKELESKAQSSEPMVPISELKKRRLGVLLEHGITYDQLTEDILSGSEGINPEIQSLKAELKALENGIEKKLTERDTAAEQQALAEMQKEAQRLATQNDDFELVREENRVPDVMKLIHQTYKQTGEVLDVSEAMQLVEAELLKDNLKRIKYKKIQSQLTPPIQPSVTQPKQMKTLTNRDSSTVPLSRRERAVLAMKGQLK